jgi:hypothetical protein
MRSIMFVVAVLLLDASLAYSADAPKSGNFKTTSAFKGIEESSQVGGRIMSHGVVYGIVTEENPLHIKTAKCPYISEIDGDTVTLKGECAWTDGEDNIFTEWSTKFSATKGDSDGAQTFTGGPVSSAASKVVTHLNVR